MSEDREPYALLLTESALLSQEHAKEIRRVMLREIGSYWEVDVAHQYTWLDFPRGDVANSKCLIAVFDGDGNWLATEDATNPLRAAQFINKTISSFIQSKEDDGQ